MAFMDVHCPARLEPSGPPGRSNRKARAFQLEIHRLRDEGYSLAAIRAALANAGMRVSKSTVHREAVRRRPVRSASPSLTTPVHDQVVAMANLLAEGDLGEIAVLIEDDWQRRGIGTALVRRLRAWAEKGHFAALVAHAAADNVAILRTLRRLGAGDAERDGGMVSVTLALPGRVGAPTESVKQ